MVIGWVPVSWTCCAIRTEASRMIEEGLGRIDVRLGTVEERRSGAGRVAVGCADISNLI